MSRALKGLAKELKVPIMVLSQLTRAPEREERKPQLADLRESGAIEQDADVVLFINRPNFYKTDLPEEDRAKAELIIAKQRNGPTGNLNFVFLGRHTRFEEAAPDAWSSGGVQEVGSASAIRINAIVVAQPTRSCRSSLGRMLACSRLTLNMRPETIAVTWLLINVLQATVDESTVELEWPSRCNNPKWMFT